MEKDWPILGSFGLASAGVAGAGAYLLSGGSQLGLALAAGLGAGLLGQFALLGLSLRHDERNSAHVRKVMRDAKLFQDETRGRHDALQARLSQYAQENDGRTDQVMQGLAEIKTSYRALQQSLTAMPANAPVFAPPPSAENSEPPTAEEAVPAASPALEVEDELADKIFFALEPIIDIPTKRTAHYRLHLGMELDGQEIASDKLLHYAARVGKRPALDLIAAREAFDLLSRLRKRDGELLIFMDVGAETLADAGALESLKAIREEAGALAQGVVFEMPHAALAGLSERALEGLAGLAREGAHFALANASVGALDLQAMNLLNVRHVGVAAGAMDADGPSTSLVGFAQVARLSRINLIVTGISNAALVPKLASITRLACGPCFAGPRRVKKHASAAAHESAALGLAA